MGKGGQGKDKPAPKKHRSKSCREYSKRRAGPRERKQGYYVRYSKETTGLHRQPPEPPVSKRARVENETPAASEAARPAAPEDATAAKAGMEAPQDDESSYEYETSEEPAKPVVVVRRYKKQQDEEELPEKAQAFKKTKSPAAGEEEEPATGAKATKERASGSTQPMQVEESEAGQAKEVEPKTAAKAKSKKAPFARAPASDAEQSSRPNVVLKEGRGVSRPGAHDQEEEESAAAGSVVLKEDPGATKPSAEKATARQAEDSNLSSEAEDARPALTKETGERAGKSKRGNGVR